MRAGISAIGMLAAAALGGCAQGPSTANGASRVTVEARYSEEELRRQLNRFFESFVTEMENAAQKISRETTDRQIARRAAVWKSRGVGRCWELVIQPNTLQAAFDVWTLCVQHRLYFEEGAGKGQFDRWEPVALETARKLESSIRQIPDLLIPKEREEEIQAKIEKWARENPIGGTLESSAIKPMEVQAAKLDLGPIGSFLDLPLAPFKGMSGVSEVAGAVHHVAATGDRATLLVQHLPRLLRMETELLLLNLEDLETVRRASGDMHTVATSVEKVSETAARLPEEVQKRVAATLEDLEKRQEGLRRTLQEAEEVSAAVGTALQNLEKAGQAWEKTAQAVQKLVPEPPEKPPPPKEDAPDIRDYDRAIQNLTRAAAEIRGTVEEVDRVAGGEGLQRAVSGGIQASRAAIDHAFWRAMELAAALFVLFVVYALLRHWLARRRGTPAPTA